MIEKPVTIEGTAVVEMTYEEALACDRRIAQAFQTAGQAMIAAYDDLRAMLSRKGYKRLARPETGAMFETWEEYIETRFGLDRTRWIQIAGHVEFMRALGEAAGKMITAVITERATRPLRSHSESILAEVRERVASGEEPERAVAETIQARQTLPPPEQARTIARETGVEVAATDGYYHDGRTVEEEERAEVDANTIYNALRAIETLATVTVTPEEYLRMLPSLDLPNLRQHLPSAMKWLQELRGQI